ncbi:UNVERIFIED_CONTAM: hypothetical protein GTU68_032817 [Idotea baltica]|nr:hypothetical protein [Idotea baltica]
MLASLVSSFNDWQLAEDVLQDAVEQAMDVWQKDGLPNSPAAWLITTARRKAIDHYRRSARFAELQPEIAYLTQLNQNQTEFDIDNVIPDKRLELIFTCCHPALDQKTQVALTLKTLGGLKTEEIAAAFLDKTTTMAQRLSRAKTKIAAASIPFELPEAQALNERLESVLSVIYLIFNEGYTASSGKSITRSDLSGEAIRLARIVLQLLPAKAEIAGLLSLMLLHDSRRFTRTNRELQFIPLEHQNRSAWDKTKINEGTALLKETLAMQQVGVYQIQAAISAIHAESASWEDTDWVQINALYELLYSMHPTAVVQVNHAIAMSYAQSVENGLALLQSIEKEPGMNTYQSFYVARADLHSRMGKTRLAKSDFKRAIELSDNEARRNFLQQKLDML